MKKAVVIFSGGLDSVSMASYLKSKHEIYGITFSYGQKAVKEIRIAKHFGKILKMKQHKIMDIDFMQELYSKSNALTSSRVKIPNEFDYTIVVPIRNAVFLSIAAAWAFSLNGELLAFGAHKDDKFYPDCRPDFTQKLESAFNSGEKDGILLGLRKKISIWSPFRAGFSKSDLVKLGYSSLGEEIFDTWSCYSNQKLHCGKCESCKNRRLAFRQANIKDKTNYET